MNPPSTGCIVLRDYENHTKAGVGGFGLVLKAKKKNENFYSAIKMIPMDMPTMGRQTLDEAKKLSAIAKHDSIVNYVDNWADELTKAEHEHFIRLIKPKKSEPFFYFPTNAKYMTFLCIRMEFCENGNLRQWLKCRDGNRVDPWENLQIFMQIARGIEHIHANKLIHRDVKPANILFFKKNAKVSDFGWSATHNVGEYQHTPHAGSALYQTPEQAFGKYGQSTDYYALGLILFELFHPDAQKNVGEALVNLKYTRKIPREIENRYPIVAELINKLISVDPFERPNCAKIMLIVKPLLDALKPRPQIGIQQNKCKRCTVTLVGTRYKCTVCPNFFLCESCEDEDEEHCEMHNFLKVKTNHANTTDGCEHYRRKCKLKCPLPECGSANGFFTCRFCHDQDIKGHKMDRFAVKEIICTTCGVQQYPRSACLHCNTSFAKYFCATCNLFDDSEDSKLIYHCFLCGICRKKTKEELLYTHCDNCSMCFPSAILSEDGEAYSDDAYFKHECKKGAGKIPCSVCHKDVYDSREPAVLAKCQHFVHRSCKDTFPNGVEKCPRCGFW